MWSKFGDQLANGREYDGTSDLQELIRISLLHNISRMVGSRGAAVETNADLNDGALLQPAKNEDRRSKNDARTKVLALLLLQ